MLAVGKSKEASRDVRLSLRLRMNGYCVSCNWEDRCGLAKALITIGVEC